ncbi:MAG: hypothetical protein RL122_562 [Pseudomonadota bacterium]|jgi:acid phosphatase family membrane protein YuiD
MDISYMVTPFLAWLVAGGLKFLVNSVRAGQWAFQLVGYGGMPSNHSAIVSSMTTLIAWREGIEHPAFGVALTLAFIVMLDANSLRGEMGKHAMMLNRLTADAAHGVLRERMGHSKTEIVAGVAVGGVVATIAYYLLVKQ